MDEVIRKIVNHCREECIRHRLKRPTRHPDPTIQWVRDLKCQFSEALIIKRFRKLHSGNPPVLSYHDRMLAITGYKGHRRFTHKPGIFSII